VIVSRAKVDDLDAIMALEASGFDHAGWSRDSWAGELTAPDRQVLAYRDADDRLVAVATLHLVADFGDLLRVVVAPERRGEGIARKLLIASILMARPAAPYASCSRSKRTTHRHVLCTRDSASHRSIVAATTTALASMRW